MPMRIGVSKEREAGEQRVALVPDSVARLTKAGIAVVVEAGAGDDAGFADAAYTAAGAIAGADPEVVLASDLVTKVRAPMRDEVRAMREGTVLISLLAAASSSEIVSALAARGVSALSLEQVPRITRAQSMDVLSSQSTVAGYKAVLIGANAMGKFLPMLTTAAGSIAPARAFVIGAGVAGLQAIATARRLGAVVSAFDVRAAAKEQVQSLGASFVADELVSAAAEGAGGYAKEQSADQQAQIRDALAKHLTQQDLVITTAQIPNRPAPRLLTTEMIRGMRPGAVVVDIAADTGGNCEPTRAGETVRVGGVVVLGPVNIAATLPTHASQMFSRNVLSLIQHLIADGRLTLDPSEEITKAMLVTPLRLAAPV
ncbi:MAG: Re/Si-specific NAD(P)(+) transhydrogenase subunit alpha [Gemmatimonadaceae bacterium]